MSSANDISKIEALFPLWYATRAFAEELVRRSLSLETASQVLQPHHRGRHRIPGTTWFYRTHGTGVDLDKGIASGGIDFDFDQAHPDPWRLHIFASKQLNDGNIASDEYWELVDDEERFKRAAEEALASAGAHTRRT